ncbi:MAG: alpha-D-ribose 1-methylphosphonate 5-triphosphate diphosphatase [Rhodobacteraceae bacterium]|nr:MAG: alpha-D-ribose 1-methylphosphonate 5-triphosphate diphosphatase [Paracoccaceae bacterium]
MTPLRLTGAQVLTPEGLARTDLSVADGVIAEAPAGRAVDLRGYLVLPGIVDLHGDGFERHLAPRRGAMKERHEGIIATEAELAANGITTGVLAQFWSWEGGLRGPDFADSVFTALAKVRESLVTDLRGQVRFETHMIDDHANLPGKLAQWGVEYVAFNDHLPHDRLGRGEQPPRLVAQALKAARSPEAHLGLMRRLHERRAEVPGALDALCARLAGMGVRIASHDDADAAARAAWRARGARISEFPETAEAAQAARDAGDGIILGAPNAVRGGSHKGNASALDLIAMGLCDALASDYHYPSPRRAAFLVADSGLLPLAQAWALVSEGPARMLGLSDRGRIEPGLRADLVILDAGTRRVAGTMAAGRFSYLAGDLAARFLG